ncbi:MAG: hypothetical protein ACP5UA_12935 [Candidatus Hydrogenedens sp.]
MFYSAFSLSLLYLLLKNQQSEEEQPINVTIRGENIRIFETLVQGISALTNPVLAQLNALKVIEIKDIIGKFLNEFKGKILFYLPTKEADKVIIGNKYRGASITINGKLYKKPMLY